MNIPQLDSTYIANTYARFPVTIARGKGSLVWDTDDKVYIDMATGIAVNSFGIADPVWIRAVTEQLCTVQHASNLYYTAPDAQLAQLLCEKTGMKKVFFSNSGAEANECAIKAARKYAADKYGPERCKIVTLINSFHGRTIATLTATGQEEMHRDFQPLVPGFIYTPANDCEALRKLVAAGKLEKLPVSTFVAAVSAGIVDNVPMLDLRYQEDSRAMVDLNCVMTAEGGIIELQGTGEGRPFTMEEQQELIALCRKGIGELTARQKALLGELV